LFTQIGWGKICFNTSRLNEVLWWLVHCIYVLYILISISYFFLLKTKRYNIYIYIFTRVLKNIYWIFYFNHVIRLIGCNDCEITCKSADKLIKYFWSWFWADTLLVHKSKLNISVKTYTYFKKVLPSCISFPSIKAGTYLYDRCIIL